jgi:hypothetical protein
MFVSIVALLLAPLVACNKSSSSGARDPGIDPDKPAGMEFTGVRPVAGKPGDQMNLTGSNLSASVASELDFGSVATPVTVTSASTATFVMPEGLGLGLKTATARVSGSDAGKVALVATSATNSLPIIISDRSQVCSDVTYINAAGDQDTGTRDCSGGGSPDPAPTPDAYNIRKGKTISGVAGKLFTTCQNRVNRDIFEMSAGSNMGYARVTNIRDGRIFRLSGIVGDPINLIRDGNLMKPVGTSHPLVSKRVGSSIDGEQYVTSLTVRESSGQSSSTYVADNDADEIAIRVTSMAPATLELSGANCVDGVGADCFDIVVADNQRDPWDTIDDLNGDTPSARAFTPADSSPYEPFQDNLCGYVEGSTPSGAIATWKDNTLSDAGQAGSCIGNAANCAMKDLLTGVTWFKGDGAVKNWYEAVYYCSTLTTSGKVWRLPTQKELMVAYANTIRNTIGSGTVQEYNQQWWSSTTDSTNPVNGWTVNLATGATASRLKSTSPAIAKALCVRSDDP